MKVNAREALRKNRMFAILGLILPGVVVSAIVAIITGLIVALESPLLTVFNVIVIVLAIPITVGVSYFYRQLINTPNDVTFEDLLKGHKDNLVGNIGNLVLMQLFIMLWTFVFIIPGIIKTFSYILTPYILGDDDIKKGADAVDPITLSRIMMDGYKLKYFVLVLSFIGWLILGAMTLQILTVIFVAPYMQLTFAKFYEERKKALDSKYLK